MLFETADGLRIDLEVFVNCQNGYGIRCETVGETGLVRLPDPATVAVRGAGRHGTAVLQDWKDRFTDALTPSSASGSRDSRPARSPPGRPPGTATPRPPSPAPPSAWSPGRPENVGMKPRPAFYAPRSAT